MTTNATTETAPETRAPPPEPKPSGLHPSPSPKPESKGASTLRGQKEDDGKPHLDVTRGGSRFRFKRLFGSWGKLRQGCSQADPLAEQSQTIF